MLYFSAEMAKKLSCRQIESVPDFLSFLNDFYMGFISYAALASELRQAEKQSRYNSARTFFIMKISFPIKHNTIQFIIRIGENT